MWSWQMLLPVVVDVTVVVMVGVLSSSLLVAPVCPCLRQLPPVSSCVISAYIAALWCEPFAKGQERVTDTVTRRTSQVG